MGGRKIFSTVRPRKIYLALTSTAGAYPIPRLAHPGDGAGGDVQRGEQGGGGPDVVVVRRCGTNGRIGTIGAVRSNAWICDYSSNNSTNAFSGGARDTRRCR